MIVEFHDEVDNLTLRLMGGGGSGDVKEREICIREEEQTEREPLRHQILQAYIRADKARSGGASRGSPVPFEPFLYSTVYTTSAPAMQY